MASTVFVYGAQSSSLNRSSFIQTYLQWLLVILYIFEQFYVNDSECFIIRINMEVRRIGGGFGCKITRSSIVTTACALAAFKLNQPVKIVLDIETNMKAIGKRNSCYSKYEVGNLIKYNKKLFGSY